MQYEAEMFAWCPFGIEGSLLLHHSPLVPFLRKTAMQKTFLARIASQELAWKRLIIDLSATKSANCSCGYSNTGQSTPQTSFLNWESLRRVVVAAAGVPASSLVFRWIHHSSIPRRA